MALDTATVNFMQWKLADFAHETTGQRISLYWRPVYWPDATLSIVSDTSRIFKYKLLLLHRLDTTIYTAVELRLFKEYWLAVQAPQLFSAHDLQAMEPAFYYQGASPWPALRTTLPVSRRRGKNQSYCAFTRPLFSADGNRTVIWQYIHTVSAHSRGESGMLLIYKRIGSNKWALEEKHDFWSSVEDSF